MKVLLVNHRFYPAEGGTERWTMGLAQALRRKGTNVTVLTQQEPGTPDREVVEGIEVLRIPMWHFGKFRLPQEYWRTLRHLDYDLLHMSGNRIWCADFYFPVAEILGPPQVITPHDFYQWAMQPDSRVNQFYFQRYLPSRLRAFDRYLAINERERQRIVSWGYPAERAVTVGEGISLAEFAGKPPPLHLQERLRNHDRLLALYVGGLWENKRVDRLVRALAPVRDSVSLVVIGRDVPDSRYNQAAVARLAEELGVEVHFLGSLEREKVVAAYQEADLFLLGSEYEGFGIALVEAMAAGLPFVSYAVGAAPELSRLGGGLVANDEKGFVDHVRSLVTDEGRRSTLRAAATAAARSLDWDKVVERYLSAYQQALTSRRSSSG